MWPQPETPDLVWMRKVYEILTEARQYGIEVVRESHRARFARFERHPVFVERRCSPQPFFKAVRQAVREEA